MKKLLFLFLAFLALNISALAQSIDSVQLVDAAWEKKKIAKNVLLLTHHFMDKNLFSANQQISYIQVKHNAGKVLFDIGAEEKTLLNTSDFGRNANALAALNGTFFDIKNGGSVDFTKKDGKVINTTKLDKNGKRARHQLAAVVINKGKLTIQKWDGTAQWEQSIIGEDVMLSGPLLRLNGTNEQLDTAEFNRVRHPRTCVGIKPNGDVLLLTVDGRHENSAGMSLFELTDVMKWLGCAAAINLDGGGSTTLWINDYPGNGVVNYPSDNKKWDHEGERKVANVILIKNKKTKK